MASANQPTIEYRGLFFALILAATWLVGGVIVAYSQGSAIRLEERIIRSAERKYGVGARQRLESWQHLLDSAKSLPESEKLVQVNAFFNRLPFVSDDDHWGRHDYWATPVEMLASNGGDCEDFSIGKYFTLIALGVPVDKLKITYVKTRDPNPVNRSHVVLTYYASQESVPLVLDNLIPEIRPASQRSDLTPVYAFNGSGLWLAKERGEGKRVPGGPTNIGFWRDLTARMGKEFE